MKKLKIKWKVSEAPTGPYRSFHRRGWPSAYYTDEAQTYAARIECEDDYYPANVKTGSHAPLTLHIVNYSKSVDGQRIWSIAKRKCTTLKELKELLLTILEQHPELMPQTKTDLTPSP